MNAPERLRSMTREGAYSPSLRQKASISCEEELCEGLTLGNAVTFIHLNEALRGPIETTRVQSVYTRANFSPSL